MRLHDLPEGTVEERIAHAGRLGFSCIQLPSKVLYASMGIGREGLTRDLAGRLREALDAAGVTVAVLGCYQNLATPDPAARAEVAAEFEACLRFAGWLGGCPVGSETGRPNAANRIGPDRFDAGALERVAGIVSELGRMAEDLGGRVLVEPGWNEVVCTPERCRALLDAVPESVGVIYDPVSLLHPSLVASGATRAVTAKMLDSCGERVEVLHAKDFHVEDDETDPGWTDGTGSRLVCHGAGETGMFDFAPLAAWARANRPGIDCVVENSVPATALACKDYLLGL